MSGQQFANAKYRNWVKAALGYKYVKEGIEPFCDDIVKQQHADIVKKVNQRHNVITSNCGQCNLWTLQPDHVRTKYKQCPLGQKDCNCQRPGRLVACPNNVCGAIYDEITSLHASTPPSPYWKNTDVKLWCSQTWAIAKCFINAPGYLQKSAAIEIDCSGLLHILINNKGLWKHINCNITGTDPFSKVRQHRNTIFHSENMEIEDAEVVTYIDDMIAVLQDSKELKQRNESKSAVKELLQLKQNDFVITASLEAEVKAAKTALIELHKELGQKCKDEIQKKGLNVKSEIEHKGSKVKEDIDTKGSDIKAEVKQKGSESKAEVYQTGLAVMAEVNQKGAYVKADVEKKGSEVMADVEEKGTEVNAKIDKNGLEVKAEIDKKGLAIEIEVKEIGLQVKAEVDQRGSKVMTEVNQKGYEVNTEVDQKVSDAMAMVDQKASGVMERVEQTGKRMMNQLQNTSSQWSESDDESRYTVLKKKFQTKLAKLYNDQVVKISPLPLLPDENCTDIVDIYVPPLMTTERQAEETKSLETTDQSKTVEKEVYMHDIFKIQGKPVKLIYVLGEAGSGKSSFCKYLVRHWCVAHSGQSCHAANKSLVKEMKNFLYLFYFSLRILSDYHSINDMLKEVYQDDILDTLLQNESQNCLIVLDGLDEWTPHGQKDSQFLTKGLPYRDASKDYTVLTTSRPWKCSSLQIKKSEINQTIKLKGIGRDSVKLLINKTVKLLNKKFKRMKDAKTCSTDIENGPVSEICHVPMLLQHMICLWFDDKLKATSKCAVCSSMLELFFEWTDQKDAKCEESSTISNEVAGLELPECLTGNEACCENKHVINRLSQLAYETLLVKGKENTLISISSALKRLNIPNDVKMRSLHTGILSENYAITLHASRRKTSSFSFIHKYVQEYLAAVFIAIQFEKMAKPLMEFDQIDVIGIECLIEYFGNRGTVDDILEQSNVFIMLSGLKPQLAACISQYIYVIVAMDGRVKDYRTALDIIERKGNHFEKCHKIPNIPDSVALDGRVKAYRTTIDRNEISDKKCNNEKFIADIQSCIMCCMKEAHSNARLFQTRVYIGDIIMSNNYSKPGAITAALDNKNIVLDCVMSMYIYTSTFITVGAFETVRHCTNLKVLRYSEYIFSTGVRNNNDIVAVIMANNISTLQMLDIPSCPGPVINAFLQYLPNMYELTSLQIRKTEGKYRFPHEQCISLSRLLTQNTRLRGISVDFDCEQNDIHVVDLSGHKQLQHIELYEHIRCVPTLNSEKLVTCIVKLNSFDEATQMFDSLSNAKNLNYLQMSITNQELVVANCRRVTESVIRLLPSLTSLSTLGLLGFNFTDNIITCPAEMKNLKEIKHCGVEMSKTTWCKFIDCLPKIPQTVHVYTATLNIIPNEKQRYMRYSKKYIANEEAFRIMYVREKTSLFHVICNNSAHFSFSTLKSKHECNSLSSKLYTT